MLRISNALMNLFAYITKILLLKQKFFNFRSQIQSIDSKIGSCQADLNTVKTTSQSSIQQIQSMLESMQTTHTQHKQVVSIYVFQLYWFKNCP